MLPIEASALIGSLAGIAEIAKESFGEEARARRARQRADDGERRHLMILDLLRQLGPWTWWIVGLILLAPRDRGAGQRPRLVRHRRDPHRSAGALHRSSPGRST